MDGKLPSSDNKLYSFPPFLLDAQERLLLRDGTTVHLSGKTFDLLLALVRSAGHLVSRNGLIDILWPHGCIEEGTLTWHMNALRKALAQNGVSTSYVQTVRGHGYRFTEPVHVHDKPSEGNPLAEAVSPENPPMPDREPQQEPLGSLQRVERETANSNLRIVYRGLKKHHVIAISFLVVAAGAITLWNSLDSRPQPTIKPFDVELPHSIAVLPFKNLSIDKENSYFVEGIQDMILTKLANIKNLKVISRVSTKGYASYPDNVKSIARQLGVSTILEGGVQKSKNQVLITVQLVDADTDRPIWANAYDETLSNIFSVEDMVATKVTRSLQLKLVPAETQKLLSIPTKSPRAYDSYLMGQYAWHKFWGQGSSSYLISAIADYREAIALDPRFALAYAALSYALTTNHYLGYDHGSAQLGAARQAANHAIRLSPDLSDGYGAKGYEYYLGNRNYEAALKEFRHALSLKPQDAMLRLYVGAVYRRQNHWKASLKEMSRAALLDPRNIFILRNLAMTDAGLRRYRQAIILERRALAINPAASDDAWNLSEMYELSGNVDKALKALDNAAPSIQNNPYIIYKRIQALILKHRLAEASKLLPELHAGAQISSNDILMLKANVLWLMGLHGKARLVYRTAVKAYQQALAQSRTNAKLYANLGLAYAFLGEKDKATRMGKQAMALDPVYRDTLLGPKLIENMAEIYAQTNEPLKAVGILRELLKTPAGWIVSIPLLKLDPAWNPIHGTTFFRALMHSGKTKQLNVARSAG